MSLIVYINSDCCNYQLNQIDETITRTYNITDVSISNARRKIALLHVPFPYDDSFEVIVAMAIELTDRVIILCSELHNTTIEFINKYTHEKICYFVNGVVAGKSTNLWLDWFITTTRVYKHMTILDNLNPYQVKEKYFDILLGQRRPHRDFIYDNINTHRISDVNIMTYLIDGTLALQQQPSSNWIWENTGLTPPRCQFSHTVTMVNYYGYNISLSQVIPISIYNQTAYSVVAETNYDNHYTFFTEKIVKPIMAKRLFIVFSGQHYLRNLRNLGFKTFDGIIDEGYDLVEDPILRFELAFKQIEYLISQPQNQILNSIKLITEYNYTVMMYTDWNRLYLNQLITKI